MTLSDLARNILRGKDPDMTRREFGRGALNIGAFSYLALNVPLLNSCKSGDPAFMTMESLNERLADLTESRYDLADALKRRVDTSLLLNFASKNNDSDMMKAMGVRMEENEISIDEIRALVEKNEMEFYRTENLIDFGSLGKPRNPMKIEKDYLDHRFIYSQLLGNNSFLVDKFERRYLKPGSDFVPNGAREFLEYLETMPSILLGKLDGEENTFGTSKVVMDGKEVQAKFYMEIYEELIAPYSARHGNPLEAWSSGDTVYANKTSTEKKLKERFAKFEGGEYSLGNMESLSPYQREEFEASRKWYQTAKFFSKGDPEKMQEIFMNHGMRDMLWHNLGGHEARHIVAREDYASLSKEGQAREEGEAMLSEVNLGDGVGDYHFHEGMATILKNMRHDPKSIYGMGARMAYESLKEDGRIN